MMTPVGRETEINRAVDSRQTLREGHGIQEESVDPILGR